MAVTTQETPTHTHKLRHFTTVIDSTHTITTTLTSHPGVARDWIHRTLFFYRRNRHRLIIGLGVQWTTHNNPAATLQLCVGRHCLIFHLHHSDTCPRILHRILLNPTITFVSLWSHSDAKKLRDSPHNLAIHPAMPIDMRTHVVDGDGNSLRRASVAEIADEVLGVSVDCDSEVGRSDWEVDELSVQQVRYATVDAFVAFAVGMRYDAWEFNPFL